MTERAGRFITFEGTDGSGKNDPDAASLPTRLAQRAAKSFRRRNPAEPKSAFSIRDILLDPANHRLCPVAEMLLYFAARAQNFDELILPSWDRGAVVLSDRFTDSTLAYQGEGRVSAKK